MLSPLWLVAFIKVWMPRTAAPSGQPLLKSLAENKGNFVRGRFRGCTVEPSDLSSFRDEGSGKHACTEAPVKFGTVEPLF